MMNQNKYLDKEWIQEYIQVWLQSRWLSIWDYIACEVCWKPAQDRYWFLSKNK